MEKKHRKVEKLLIIDKKNPHTSSYMIYLQFEDNKPFSWKYVVIIMMCQMWWKTNSNIRLVQSAMEVQTFANRKGMKNHDFLCFYGWQMSGKIIPK